MLVVAICDLVAIYCLAIFVFSSILRLWTVSQVNNPFDLELL